MSKLATDGEYDILHHLYKKGPKGSELWTLYWKHCFKDWDIFLLELKLRMEFNQ